VSGDDNRYEAACAIPLSGILFTQPPDINHGTQKSRDLLRARIPLIEVVSLKKRAQYSTSTTWPIPKIIV